MAAIGTIRTIVKFRSPALQVFGWTKRIAVLNPVSLRRELQTNDLKGQGLSDLIIQSHNMISQIFQNVRWIRIVHQETKYASLDVAYVILLLL